MMVPGGFCRQGWLFSCSSSNFGVGVVRAGDAFRRVTSSSKQYYVSETHRWTGSTSGLLCIHSVATISRVKL